MVQIAVDAVDSVTQITHKLNGEIRVAGGKGGQTAVVVQSGVHAGSAGQIFVAAEGAEILRILGGLYQKAIV